MCKKEKKNMNNEELPRTSTDVVNDIKKTSLTKDVQPPMPQ